MVSSHRRCLRTIAYRSQRDRFVALRRMHAPVPGPPKLPCEGVLRVGLAMHEVHLRRATLSIPVSYSIDPALKLVPIAMRVSVA